MKPVRLTILGINYRPELTGIAVYNTDMARFLAQRGHEVTMLTGFPYYPQWRKPEEYKGKLYASEADGAVKLKRCYVYVPGQVSSLKRILHEASFLVSAGLRLLFSRRPEVLFVVSPPLGLGILARLYGAVFRVPYLFHIQDLQPDAAVKLGMLPEGRLSRLLYAVARFSYRGAAAVGVISRGMERAVLAQGIKPESIRMLPNWADTEGIQPGPTDNDFRRQHGVGAGRLVLHFGNMGMKQRLDVLVRAAALMKDEDVRFLIVGDGADRPRVMATAEELAADNVNFLPVQPRERLPEMLAAADLCVITQAADVTDFVLPSKLLGIMAAGRASIVSAAADSEVAGQVTGSGIGLVVEPESPQALAEGIRRLLSDDVERSRLGEAARHYAEANLSRDSVLAGLEGLLIELAGTGNGR